MYYESELYHHGVKGMKWGVIRERPRSNVQIAKSNYKSAKKAYNKSFSKAYNNAIAAYSPIKKHREANDARWEQSRSDARKLNSAEKAYKQAKKDRKRSINNNYKQLNKNASLGEKMLYNDTTRKKAAKYMTDRNMSASEATKKAKRAAWRNTAPLVGGMAGASVAPMIANKAATSLGRKAATDAIRKIAQNSTTVYEGVYRVVR